MSRLPNFRPFLFNDPPPTPKPPSPQPIEIDPVALGAAIVKAGRIRRGLEPAPLLPPQSAPGPIADPKALADAICRAAAKARNGA